VEPPAGSRGRAPVREAKLPWSWKLSEDRTSKGRGKLVVWLSWMSFEVISCLVHHRRQLHNRLCMWQKVGRNSEARKPWSLKSGRLEPAVYAYADNPELIKNTVETAGQVHCAIPDCPVNFCFICSGNAYLVFFSWLDRPLRGIFCNRKWRRLWKKTVEHVDWIGRMPWIVLDGESW